MSKQIDLIEAIATFVDADPTGSHQAYRAYQENLRSMLCEISLVLSGDAREAAAWLRKREPAEGPGLRWWERAWLSARLRGHANNAAEAYLEAAKAVVRMATVHEEYLMAERRHNSNSNSGGPRSGRYETKDGA